MNNTIFKTICLIGAVIYGNITLGQITTFDYLNTTFPANCNIFIPPLSISGHTHSSLAGGVSYSAATGVFLGTTPISAQPGGTAFTIQYNFIPGNKYDISIVATSGLGVALSAFVIPTVNNTNFPTSRNASCITDPYVGFYSTSAPLYGKSFNPNSTSATYIVPQFTVTGASVNQYLVIWAFGGSLSLDGASIGKIIITQTPPPTFTISPATLSPTCGNPISATFTANNVNNVTGVTGYTWNLGGTNNGWNYLGIAAPPTITTATNTLALTSLCAVKPNNVAVTVNMGTPSYGPYTATVSPTVPGPSIIEASGKTFLCARTTNNYVITNVPCGATSSWIVNQSGVTGGTVSYTINGNAVSITNPSPGLTGYVSLTGTINTACGNRSNGATIVISGTGPALPAFQPTWPNYPSTPTICPNGGGIYLLLTNASADTYNWNWDHSSLSLYNGGSPHSNTITLAALPTFGNGWVSIATTNSCGVSPTYYMSIGRTSSSLCPPNHYIVSPNPASSTITIAEDPSAMAAAVATTKTGFTNIEIYDKMGNLKKRLKFSKGTTRQTIDISALPTDNYVLRIFNGTTWEEHQLIIAK